MRTRDDARPARGDRGAQARSDRRDAPRRRSRRRGPSPALAIVVLLALMGGAFALGWHFGVESTRFHGNILLVNADHRLPADYVPEGLVNLYQMRHSFRLASSEIYLTRETYEAAEKMFHAAEEQDMNGFYITSGYRSYQRQAEVYAESEPGKAQEPGASEHQTGMAFDVTAESSSGDFETTAQYGWLMQHAHEYGFIQRYPANKSDITGISYEPWHYRFVGVDAATRMYKTGQCLEELIAANQ